MRRQNISQRLESIGSSFSKAVNFYLTHPEHNPLTDEEKDIAIAAMAELKTLDHSWTVQNYMSNYMVNASDSDTNSIAFDNLRNLPRLFHALANPTESLGNDSKLE